MKIIHNIIAFTTLLLLLISSTGFTLEHHFCTHCKENIEEAYFLFPDNNELNHHCSCEDHKSQEHESCCKEDCAVNESKHVEHFSAEITTIIPQNNIDDIVKSISLLFTNAIQINWISETLLITKHTNVQKHIPPDPPDLNITNCCFLF